MAASLAPVHNGSLAEITPKNWHRYPLPITPAMLAPANQHADKPRYNVAGDWHGGDVGNDVDISDSSQAIAGQNGGVNADYEPRHQEEKSEDMIPPTPMLSDLGKDYGVYAGQTGRTGTIGPRDPYPSGV